MFVKYEGGTESYYGCSDPKVLKAGQIYEVMFANDRGWQTDYELNGVEGQFNSIWFEEVNVYKAITKRKPKIGYSMHCWKLESNDREQPQVTNWITTKVQKIEKITSDFFRVTTKNSIYEVLVF